MKEYNDDSIKVLSDIEHVRTRSSMYINTERPSYQMWTEIADNAIDEAMNSYARMLLFKVDFDKSSILIEDDGRGLPQGMNEDLHKPTIYAIYQKLNAGGKYDQESYAYSGGLNGVGSTVVNALSKELKVTTWRDNSVVICGFRYGQSDYYDKYIDKSTEYKKSGTRVEYTIDTEHKIFTDKLSDYKEEIYNKLKLIKTLLPNIRVIYQDDEIEATDFREFLKLTDQPLLDNSILIEKKEYKLALNWSKDTNRSTHNTYCNSVFTVNGGDHLSAVQNTVCEIFGNDSLYGINIALSVNYPGVEYDSQSKTKAISKSMKSHLSEILLPELKSYFRQNPDIKENISKLIQYKRNEINKRNNKSNVRRDRKSAFLNTLGVSGFADCITKDRSNAELFIVEGNSAAGSAIQARNVDTQAVMPLRGKFINAFTADVASLMKNAEVATIVSSIDAGMFDDVNIKKSRYDKIIIMTDADEDGKNIACLLISFFLDTMPELVESGMVYIALPPLYGTFDKNKFVPINDEEVKDMYLKKGYSITRYKGLGEMNPEQLALACMDPETRQIIRVDKSDNCIEEVRKIMGSDTSYRRQLLINEGVLIA